jgi:hypothetical protein
MSDQTKTESIASHPLVTLVANAAAIALPLVIPGVTPLVAALPVLADTLAAGRQTARVEKVLSELTEDVSQLKLDLTKITDDQFKLSGECVTAMMSTINEQKLAYLRQAVVNSLSDPDVAQGNSEALARLMRDISADETAFTVRAFRSNSVSIDKNESKRSDALHVVPGSRDEELVGGLIRLGFLYTKSTSWDAQMYEWAPITAKFIALVSRLP